MAKQDDKPPKTPIEFSTFRRGVQGLVLVFAAAFLVLSAGVLTVTNKLDVTNVPVLPGAEPPPLSPLRVALDQCQARPEFPSLKDGIYSCQLRHGDTLTYRHDYNGGRATGISAEVRNQACWNAKKYAADQLVAGALSRNDPTEEYLCLNSMIEVESAGWDPWVVNPRSDARFLFQYIYDLYGPVAKAGDWKAQVDWGLAYIKDRYGTACNAWAFWLRIDPRPWPDHWY